MKINIIGAGRLGQHLAASLLELRRAQPLTIYSRSLNSALHAIKTLGAGHAVESVSALPCADITFITAPDDAIEGIVTQLTHNHCILPGQIIAHCSGVLAAEILAPLRERGGLVASLHPLRAFRAHHVHVNAFKDCDCVVEGDPDAVLTLTTLFTEMGAHVIPILASKKATYHAAAVMASNYMVTLASCAMALFHEAGLSEAQAQNITKDLMHSSLTHIRDATHIKHALTGPLARGDIQTVTLHLDAIQSESVNALYRTAGLATLPLTNMDEAIRTALKNKLQ